MLVFIDRWSLFEDFCVLFDQWTVIRVWPLLTGWSLLTGTLFRCLRKKKTINSFHFCPSSLANIFKNKLLLCVISSLLFSGRWKGHVKHGSTLCGRGWRVCSSHDAQRLENLSWLDILDIKGCYAYNVANDKRGKCRR